MHFLMYSTGQEAQTMKVVSNIKSIGLCVKYRLRTLENLPRIGTQPNMQQSKGGSYFNQNQDLPI